MKLLRAAFVSLSHRRGRHNWYARGRRLMAMATMDGDGAQPSRGPALVDVDCNLLHADLITVMESVSSIEVEGAPPLQILHHPSTVASNIRGMLSPSSSTDESERSVELLTSSTAQQRNGVEIKTTVGVHPYHALEEGDPDASIGRIRALLDHPDARRTIGCIGETGLDYSEGFPDREHQMPWFRAQLDLAFEYDLPVFLHERLAFDDTLQCIDEAMGKHAGQPMPKIIVHCYTGTYEECVEYINRGYHTSIAGGRASAGSEEVKRCLREGIIPLDRLMIETDAPYMGFAGNKDSFFEAEGEAFSSLSAKKRKRLKSQYPNVPSALPLVLEMVCDELNVGRRERNEEELTLQELAEITTTNAIGFFGLDGNK
ncbi:hypothetical protein ACHAXT_012791 [Thalassiosira profunda]